MDQRAIVDRGKLIVGSVRAVGDFRSGKDDPNWGNVEVSVLEIDSGTTRRTVIRRHLEQNDHDNPAFMKLADGRYLAVYSKHAVERKVYSRISEPGDPLAWGPVATFESPGADRPAYGGNNVTYTNLFRMPDGARLDARHLPAQSRPVEHRGRGDDLAPRIQRVTEQPALGILDAKRRGRFPRRLNGNELE
jgi:hypothetical protein